MLLRILLLILIVVAARSFWRVVDGIIEGATGRGSTHATSTRLVRDPVCGTWVLPNAEMSLIEGKRKLFFCSPACRDHYRSRTA